MPPRPVGPQKDIKDVLASHNALEPVMNTLSWKNSKFSLGLFLVGPVVYFLNQVVGIVLLMLLGVVAIVQVLVFRLLTKLQSHQIISPKVDLKKSFVVVPDSSTAKTISLVLFDFARLTEERIKDTALSRDVMQFIEMVMLLSFTAALGSVVPLAEMLLAGWVIAFTSIPIYRINKPFFDSIPTSLQEIVNKNKSD